MDERLRRLRRAAAGGDPEAVEAYAAALARFDPEEILRANPDDDDAWQAWADQLGADPRAPFARQGGPPLRLLDSATAPELRAEVQWAPEAWLGPLAGRHGPTARRLLWQRGYWHTLTNYASHRPLAWWEEILSHPSARFLRRLAIRWLAPELTLELLGRHRPPLRWLHWQEETPRPVALEQAMEALPWLETLALWVQASAREGWRWPRLRALSLNGCYDHGLPDDLAAAAPGGAFLALEELSISTGFDHELADMLRALLAHAPRLRALTVLGGNRVEPLCEVIAASGVLARLRSLHVCAARFDPDLERAWVEQLEARPEPLDKLHAEVYELSPDGSARLRECAREVYLYD